MYVRLRLFNPLIKKVFKNSLSYRDVFKTPHKEIVFMKNQILIFLFVVSCSLIFSQEQDQPRLAVVKFITNNNIRAQEISNIVRDLVESKMISRGEYEVVTQSQIDRLMKNQKIQLDFVSSDENLKKLLLQNIHYLVIGTLGFMDNTCAITVKLLDVKTGKFINSASEVIKDDISALFEGTSALAYDLIDDRLEDTYEIGDIGQGGGLIFYIEDGNYLECSELLEEVNWNDAFAVAENFQGGGYDDWYLPTKEELNYIYENLRSSDFISGDEWLWSSSDIDYSFAWMQRFSDGLNTYGSNKANPCYVRAVRALNF